MSNPYPYRLFNDPTGPNSVFRFGDGNSPTWYDMLYLPLQWPSRGEVWTIGKGSPLHPVFGPLLGYIRMGGGSGTVPYQKMSLCNLCWGNCLVWEYLSYFRLIVGPHVLLNMWVIGHLAKLTTKSISWGERTWFLVWWHKRGTYRATALCWLLVGPAGHGGPMPTNEVNTGLSLLMWVKYHSIQCLTVLFSFQQNWYQDAVGISVWTSTLVITGIKKHFAWHIKR